MIYCWCWVSFPMSSPTCQSQPPSLSPPFPAGFGAPTKPGYELTVPDILWRSNVPPPRCERHCHRAKRAPVQVKRSTGTLTLARSENTLEVCAVTLLTSPFAVFVRHKDRVCARRWITWWVSSVVPKVESPHPRSSLGSRRSPTAVQGNKKF